MQMTATISKNDGTIAKVVELAGIADDIRSGRYRDDIALIRLINEKRKRSAAKYERLPSFRAGSHYKECIPEGRRTNVVRENFLSNDGLSMLDFDNSEKPEQIAAAYRDEPSCVMMFRSPSGNGLKAVVAHQATDSYGAYRTLKKYLQVPFRDAADPACFSNASLGAFMSYDPDIFFNPHPVPMTVEIPSENPRAPKLEKALHLGPCPESAPVLEKVLLAILPFLKIQQYDDYFKVGSALAALKKPDFWFAVLERTDWTVYGRPYDRDEATRDYENYRRNTEIRITGGLPCYGLGSLVRMARENGFNDVTILMLFGGLI